MRNVEEILRAEDLDNDQYSLVEEAIHAANHQQDFMHNFQNSAHGYQTNAAQQQLSGINFHPGHSQSQNSNSVPGGRS